MKSLYLLPLLVLFALSCSENHLTGVNYQPTAEGETYSLDYEIELTARIDSIDNLFSKKPLNSKDYTFSQSCLDKCYKAYKTCYDNAYRFRESDYAACEAERILKVIEVDVYCTRKILVGYETIIKYNEEVEVPVYREEQYVCGQKEETIYKTEPEDLEKYRVCRIAAMEYFLDSYESCLLERIRCEDRCKKPGFPEDGGGIGGEH